MDEGIPPRKSLQAKAAERHADYYRELTWVRSSTYAALAAISDRVLVGTRRSLADLRGCSRKRELVLIWVAFCRAARTDHTLESIGRFLHKNHATVIHALKKAGSS
jgi:chromosomal replication initiation ATPase DnaA